MVKKKMRRVMGVLLALMIAIIPAVSAFATGESEYTYEYDGVVFTITTSIDPVALTKTVEVLGDDGSYSVSVMDYAANTITTESDDGFEVVVDIDEVISPPMTRATISTTTLYWGYYCGKSDTNYTSSIGGRQAGYFWMLRNPDGFPGSISFFDYMRLDLRMECQQYLNYVGDILSNQVAATSACGTAAAGIVAAVIGGAPTLGVSVVVGAVLAVGGSITAVPFFVMAWSSSVSANTQYRMILNQM